MGGSLRRGEPGTGTLALADVLALEWKVHTRSEAKLRVSPFRYPFHAVMPLDVLGRTRATLTEPTSSFP